MEKCPTCERKLVRLEDFPLVYVSGFERLEFPSGLEFPYQDYTIFVGPKVEAGNEKPPQEVLNFFRDNREAHCFEHQGWNWELNERVPGGPYGVALPSLFEKMLRFFRGRMTNEGERVEDWESSIYHRIQKNQKEIILQHLNPYLDQLAGLVGKEVPILQLLPKFERNGYFGWSFNIPETDYNLNFSEEETNSNMKRANITILGEGPNMGSAGGPTLEELATVGKLDYEGRLR